MADDFDIKYVKGNTVSHFDALSRLKFNKGQKENKWKSRMKKY